MFICGKIYRSMAITPPPRPAGWSPENMQSRHGVAQSGGIWGVNKAAPCQTKSEDYINPHRNSKREQNEPAKETWC